MIRLLPPEPPIPPLPDEAIHPLTSTHPAIAAWRVFNPAFGLSLREQEIICRAFIAREEERRVLLENSSTMTWALQAGQ